MLIFVLYYAEISKTAISNFGYKNKQIEYQEALVNKFTESSNETSSQEHWNNIVLSCKSAGEKVLGEKTRKKKIDSPELKNLSNESHQIQLKIEATKDPEKREKLNQERKKHRKEVKKNQS